MEKIKKTNFIGHCTITAFDGNSTIQSRPTKSVAAINKKEAINEIKKEFISSYTNLGCSNISVTIELIKEIS